MNITVQLNKTAACFAMQEHTGRDGYHGNPESFLGIAADGQSVDQFVDDPIA